MVDDPTETEGAVQVSTGGVAIADRAPGEVSVDQFIDALEQINRERTGTDDWSFTDAQREVITYEGGPLHVTAGPGAGKTEVGIARVLRWLIVDGIAPEAIVLTTFTEKAATQLEQRLATRVAALGFGDQIDAYDVWVGTLHGLCGDIMREFRYDEYTNVELLDPDAQRMFVQQHCEFVDYLSDGAAGAFPSIASNTYDDGGCSKTTAAGMTTTLFNRLAQYRVDIDELGDADEEPLRRLADAYTHYQQLLRDTAKCDFAQLQLRFLEFLETEAGGRFLHGDEDREIPPLRRVLVDEYQDVNPLQQAIYFALARHSSDSEITVVGDDDQALYRFRGATVDCFIEFPERIADVLHLRPTDVPTIQLRHNYRSHPDIVAWCTQHIGDHPVMNEPGARAPGKEPMDAAREGDPDDTRVKFLEGQTIPNTAEGIADTIAELHDSGYVDDYNQIAILAHSTREEWQQWGNRTFVGECVDELAARDISVYNPRNKALLDHDEVQLMLAALRRCIDPEGQWAADNVYDNSRVNGLVETWEATLDRYEEQGAAEDLLSTVDEIAEEIQTAESGRLPTSLLEVVHRLRAADPISGWTQGPGRHPERAKRLGKLTSLITSLEVIADGLSDDRHLLRTSHDDYETVSTQFLRDFYWMFCAYLDDVDLDDPEDQHDQFPEDHVQVMTVHQAKGLEFPVVFVTSLSQTVDVDDTGPQFADRMAPFAERTPPVGPVERQRRDLIRQFYVAHSRAEEQLILSGSSRQTNEPPEDSLPAFGYDGVHPVGPADFMGDRSVRRPGDAMGDAPPIGPTTEDEIKQEYSIVGDVLAFRRCKRQYGFLTEYGFESAQAVQLFAGQAVHQTLDWAHRHYNGDVDGVDGGDIPTETELKAYFDDVVEALEHQRILPLTGSAVERVFAHLAEFNEEVGPELYPHVVDTECTLRHSNEDHILTGQADVISSEDAGIEIVDYKASKRPDDDDMFLDDYREQLRVYAGLYYVQEAELPEQAVIYFIHEDVPEAMRLEVEFDESELAAALDGFQRTVETLEQTRSDDSWTQITPDEAPDEATCDACDFRRDCPAYQ